VHGRYAALAPGDRRRWEWESAEGNSLASLAAGAVGGGLRSARSAAAARLFAWDCATGGALAHRPAGHHRRPRLAHRVRGRGAGTANAAGAVHAVAFATGSEA
jgi:hypothetical protein